MEATCFSETPVSFQQSTRRNIPGDSTLHENYCLLKKLKIKTKKRSLWMSLGTLL
jgi:hypothetical protein